MARARLDHHLQVVVPEKVRNPDIAFVFVTGMATAKAARDAEGGATRGAMAAVVTKVPNQPLYDGRKEDALIAYTFDQYLKSATRPGLCSFRW
jgi:PhoPQ-activated pathogenicity-related protein